MFSADLAKCLYFLCKSFSIRFTEKKAYKLTFLNSTRLLFFCLTHFYLRRVTIFLSGLVPQKKVIFYVLNNYNNFGINDHFRQHRFKYSRNNICYLIENHLMCAPYTSIFVEWISVFWATGNHRNSLTINSSASYRFRDVVGSIVSMVGWRA